MRLPDTRPDTTTPYGYGPSSTNLADILERVLDKGIVIAGVPAHPLLGLRPAMRSSEWRHEGGQPASTEETGPTGQK